MNMVLNIIYFFVGLTLLFFGGDFLVRGSSRLAVMARIRPLVIGVTIVAFGTSTPEFLVSYVAAFSNHINMAVGNIVGSNIANIGLVLGLSCLLLPVTMKQTKIDTEYRWMIFASIIFWLFGINGIISPIEGGLLFACILVFTYLLVRLVLKDRKTNKENVEILKETETLKRYSPKIRLLIFFLLIVVGIALLVFGSKITIYSAKNIAAIFGISETIISLSLVAFGTSLPELATSVISLLRKENAILLGNIIGSNLFNLLFVGGGISMIFSLPIETRILYLDIPLMLLISLMLIPSLIKKNISRLTGAIFLIYYILYICFIYFNQ
jgi:cation:H+ antiporter